MKLKLKTTAAEKNELCDNAICFMIRNGNTDSDSIKTMLSKKFTSKQIDDGITRLKSAGRIE